MRREGGEPTAPNWWSVILERVGLGGQVKARGVVVFRYWGGWICRHPSYHWECPPILFWWSSFFALLFSFSFQEYISSFCISLLLWHNSMSLKDRKWEMQQYKKSVGGEVQNILWFVRLKKPAIWRQKRVETHPTSPVTISLVTIVNLSTLEPFSPPQNFQQRNNRPCCLFSVQTFEWTRVRRGWGRGVVVMVGGGVFAWEPSSD